MSMQDNQFCYLIMDDRWKRGYQLLDEFTGATLLAPQRTCLGGLCVLVAPQARDHTADPGLHTNVGR